MQVSIGGDREVQKEDIITTKQKTRWASEKDRGGARSKGDIRVAWGEEVGFGRAIEDIDNGS